MADEDEESNKTTGCSMYSNCGKVGYFGQELPCPDHSPARKTTPIITEKLKSICGPEFGSLNSVCCTIDQIEFLSESLNQAEPLISTCPACRNNFRNFYCHFTCSPTQSNFINITSTQIVKNTKTGNDNEAIKSVDFYVNPDFGESFFNSCKDVKFGPTNGFVLDLLAGGAKTWIEFLKFMGKERPGLGSPFQINFPIYQSTNQTKFQPLNPISLKCDDKSLNSKCACADCPSVCTELPPSLPPFISLPKSNSSCQIGQVDCLDFSAILFYALALSASLLFIIWKDVLKTRKITLASRRNGGDNDSGYETPSGYERVSMHDPLAPNTASTSEDDNDEEQEEEQNSRPKLNPPVGASSMADTADHYFARSQRSSSPNTSHSFFSPHRLAGIGTSSDDAQTRLMAINHHQPRSYPLNVVLSRVFYKIGLTCSTKPYLIITIALLICGGLNLGWSKFEIEKEPDKLWVSDKSKSGIEKKKFEENFGPFYRTEQFFFTSLNSQDEGVLTFERLKWIYQFEKDIRNLKSTSGLNLNSVCLAPTSIIQPPKSSLDCVVQSIIGYFGNSLNDITNENWAKRLDNCASNPTNCLPNYGQPLNPHLILGGIPISNQNSTKVEEEEDNPKVFASKAKAVIITFVINNSLDLNSLQDAKEWETVLKVHLENLTSDNDRGPETVGMKISWSTEISLESEINKSTNTDIPIVVMSYLAMFFYVAINLGGSASAIVYATLRAIISIIKLAIPNVLRFNSNQVDHRFAPTNLHHSPSLKRQLLIESKFSLALWSIAIVLLSVSTSIGFFSMLGIKTTLIIAEVIPFLCLAFGVDNIFLLSNELSAQNSKAYKALARAGLGYSGEEDDDDEDEDEGGGLPSIESRIAKAVSRMGPSILLSTTSEAVVFGLGSIVDMPAVRNFAIYAAGAVIINSVLQFTVFVSAMAIDMHRMEDHRVDCFPCLRLASTRISANDMAIASGKGDVATFVRTIYAPMLVKRPVKILVICIFSGLFVFSILSTRKIELGLDQRLALPPESHLVDYFDALDQYLDVGPPVYFVAEGVKVTERVGQQSLCGRFSTCEDLSLANVLEAERKRPTSSFVAVPPAVWIDDFFQWLNPALESCCRVKRKDPNTFCTPRDRERDCKACYADLSPGWNVTMEGFPEGESFMRYLNHWLSSPTTESCPLGGRATYHDALKISSSGNSVEASSFRTSHTSVKAQADYINAMVSARQIATSLSERLGSRVYAYSIFYVFFDQYITIRLTAFELLFLALTSVFLVSTALLGSWRTAAVIVGTVLMMFANILGAMGLWDVNLNAISLVNLVIGVGIGVEFCAHIARAFIGANGGGLPQRHSHGQRDRDERICFALGDVGASVFSGIFSTKIIGITVLGLTRSKLLEIYYFRMWLVLILSGAIHALIFFPVALSFVGGQGYALDDDRELAHMVNSRYEGLLEDEDVEE
ncbi:hypothetical protein CROQUDRAFT_54585 [Cronartium quercuum f. sp. fusiforme G11]|uniref:SSD domain-containing protein n=1 Tax=Cronartium quercuum f. sp. fusiforme G11 TaxID=708437 RepID=A0A9P6N5D3_9BASI|nr:hypothetical protein CROQUDRAFT_54585 [Cronartium quercuum f. sp. fusiforme G11]